MLYVGSEGCRVAQTEKVKIVFSPTVLNPLPNNKFYTFKITLRSQLNCDFKAILSFKASLV